MDNPENNRQASDGVGTSRGSRGRASSASPSRGRDPRGGASSSSPSRGRGPRGRALSASPSRGNQELVFDENITNTLNRDEVTNLLYRGHENEHIAQNLLNPPIGAPITCTYCHENIIFDQPQSIGKQPVRDFRNRHFHRVCYWCYYEYMRLMQQ